MPKGNAPFTFKHYNNRVRYSCIFKQRNALMLKGQFPIPAVLDYTAAFLFALTGGLVAYEKDYDFTGLAAMAISVGLGGALIRDGIFLQQIPAVVANWRYLAAVAVAILIAVLIGDLISKHMTVVILIADALGLGLYGVVGAQKSINLGLTAYAALLIGVINAIGGGLLRDIITGEDPVAFKPGQIYALAAITGVSVFVILGAGFKTPAWIAATACIVTTFVLRIFTVVFDVKTHPVHEHALRKKIKHGVKTTVHKIRPPKRDRLGE